MLFQLLSGSSEPGNNGADANAVPVMNHAILKTVGVPSGLKPLVLEGAFRVGLFFLLFLGFCFVFFLLVKRVFWSTGLYRGLP